MTTPQRVQLRRTKGWRLPANTVVVARPSIYGNPFRVFEEPTKPTTWTVHYVPNPRIDIGAAIVRLCFARTGRSSRSDRSYRCRAHTGRRGRRRACDDPLTAALSPTEGYSAYALNETAPAQPFVESMFRDPGAMAAACAADALCVGFDSTGVFAAGSASLTAAVGAAWVKAAGAPWARAA